MVEGLRRFPFPVFLVAAGSRPRFLACGIWAYTPGVGGSFEMKPGSWTPTGMVGTTADVAGFFSSFLLLHICILAFARAAASGGFLDSFYRKQTAFFNH